jgi:hypothetical protein
MALIFGDRFLRIWATPIVMITVGSISQLTVTFRLYPFVERNTQSAVYTARSLYFWHYFVVLEGPFTEMRQHSIAAAEPIFGEPNIEFSCPAASAR